MKNSKDISRISLGLFCLVIVLLISSTYFINVCLKRQEKAEENRIAYKKLGESLADASDYLTDEVRMFAVTQDIKHFYNYWNEAEVVMTREYVINELKDGNGPKREFELLRAAKYYSDMLMQLEISSMQLVLKSMGATKETYREDKLLMKWVEDVLDYEIDTRYQELVSSQVNDVSVTMLYDSNYQEYKEYIMGNIEDFQEVMNQRLDKTVYEAKMGTNGATILQLTLFSVALCIIGGLLFLIHRLYIRPLKNYTQVIVREGKGAKYNFRLKPEGANEIVELGSAFNKLLEEINHELTTRKIAEKKMRVAKEKADKANQSKSNFIAQMSHELRTPLNAINGYLYLISESKLSENQKRYTDNISLASNNLLEMINNILDLSKMEAGKLKLDCAVFDLLKLLEEVQCVLENEAANKKLQFKIITKDKVPQYLKGDSMRLRQVLINLLYNGIKFTQEGIVMLTIEGIDTGNDSCTLLFSVKDTGIGVERKKQKTIFDIFTQSDNSLSRKYGGTGLGLPISRQIIRLVSNNKYDLQLESKLGEGSCFSFLMDFTIAKPLITDVNVSKMNYRVSVDKTIMIVDDNDVNLIMEKEILTRMGFQVITEKDGKSALIRLQEVSVDLVLLDICMPEMDGYEVAKRLRQTKRHQETPIVALSANVTRSVVDSIKELGMNAYIEKPINMNKFMSVLSSLFDFPNIKNQDSENLVFDRKQIEKIMDNNKSNILKLLEIFLITHERANQTIKSMIEQKQMNEVLSELHKLKGVSLNLYLTSLVSACEELKTAIENKTEITNNLEHFYQIFSVTIKEINAYMEDITKVEEEDNDVQCTIG